MVVPQLMSNLRLINHIDNSFHGQFLEIIADARIQHFSGVNELVRFQWSSIQFEVPNFEH